MTTPKLTPPMRVALEAVSRGEVYFSRRDGVTHGSSVLPICDMLGLGLVKVKPPHILLRLFTVKWPVIITEAGRKALEEK